MDKIELYSGGFPVTTETFEFLQESTAKALTALTALGGETFILKGVQLSGSNVSDGTIVYQGEILPFRGGSKTATVSIYEEVTEVAYNEDANNDGNLDPKRAYIRRYAKCGTGGLESFSFSLLKEFAPLTQISTPVGGIIMWSGAINNIPAGWVLCNGQNGTPDLRNRFVVGAGSSYATGAEGGANSVSLTEAQMPAHNHSGNTSSNGSHKHTGSTYAGGSHNHSVTTSQSHDGFGKFTGGGGASEPSAMSTNNAGSHSHTLNMNNAGAHTHNFTTDSKGSGQAHENRPPYYAVAFIMFKGF